jgi:Amidohydrolase family
MSQFRVLSLAGIVGAGLIALVANLIIADGKSLASTYCVSDPTSFILTLNDSLPRARCFSVQDGIFTDVFEEIQEVNGEQLKSLDGFALPGLIDSHGHILQYGEMLESVSLYGAESIPDVRTKIKEFLKKHQGEGYGSRGKWIRGIGWDQKYFGGVMPTAVNQSALLFLSELTYVTKRARGGPPAIRSLHNASSC